MEKFDLEKYKGKLLEMTRILDAFCREHQLRYSLCAGSLLGAVRHHGIIPWDDDVDVMMPRPDYNKLLSLAKDGLVQGYGIVYAKNTPHYYLPLAKMVDLNTCLVEFRHNMECPIGVNIDIFPIDVVPDDIQERERLYTLFRKCYVEASVTAEYAHFKSPFVDGKFRLRTLLHYFRNHVYRLSKNSAAIFQMMDDKVSAFDWNKGKECRFYGSYQYHQYLFDKSWFEEYVDLDFGGIQAMAIKRYDDYLRTLYHDYMQLPPKEKQICHHHHFFLDLDRGYSVDELKNMGIIRY